MLVRRLAAVAISLLGTCFVIALVLAMNTTGLSQDTTRGEAEVSFAVEPPKAKPPRPQRPQRKKKAKKSRDNPPPAPIVGASLAGLAFGLDDLMGGGLGSDVDALLGDVRDVVMSEDAVDDPPKPLQRVPPSYPERARAKGISGMVQMSLLIGLDGRVEDARVLESNPPGTFDEAALTAVRQWRFQPAMYEGRPVAVRVTQALRFGFEE